jgi:hypothetical protein
VGKKKADHKDQPKGVMKVVWSCLVSEGVGVWCLYKIQFELKEQNCIIAMIAKVHLW